MLDSLIKSAVVTPDSVKAIVQNKQQLNPNFLDQVNFSDIIVALLAASVALLLNVIYDGIKSQNDIKTKKKVLKLDLNNQVKVLERMRKDFIELISRFESGKFEPYVMDAFEDLHTDIYQSISKEDVFKIYGDKIIVVAEIYKIIGYLINHLPNELYKKYDVIKSNHLREKNYDMAHFNCETQQSNIKNTITNSELNIKSIDNAVEKIRLLLS